MKIGIIGGGQLGMMMAESAKKLGHSIYSLDPSIDCPITRVSDKHIAANFSDTKAIKKLIEISDVVTYEFENINLDYIQNNEKKIPQGLYALKVSQNRLLEKNTVKNLGVETPLFSVYNSSKTLPIPSIIKSISGGYDGKNQYKIFNNNDIDQLEIDDSMGYIVEEYINFDYEISVILTRDKFGEIGYYPIPINKHKNGILFTSVVNNTISPEIIEKAQKISKIIIDNLNYIGTMAVEFFVKGNQVLFNEFAPRPHNSGHYSIEACNVSQFKNHILAITGHHIIKPILTNNAIMLNILGQNELYIENAAGIKYAYTHLYGKKEYRTDRKIGHITIVSEDNLSILNEIVKE